MCLFKNVMSAKLDAIFRVKDTSDLRLNGNTSAQVSRRHKHLLTIALLPEHNS